MHHALRTAVLLLALVAGPALAAEDTTWWSLRPLTLPTPPAAAPAGFDNWARTPIDRFILARLHEKGLEPAPEADRRTLLRRLTFDLLGLPPTPEEVEAFAADLAPDAYEKVVERLL